MIKPLIGVALFASLLSAPAFGGSASHGGDRHLDEENPWFLASAEAPRPVVVCVASGTELATESQKAMVAESLAAWKAFLQRHELDKARFRDVIRAQHHLAPPVAGGMSALRLNLDFEFDDAFGQPAAFTRYCDLSVFFGKSGHIDGVAPLDDDQRVGQADRVAPLSPADDGPKLNAWSHRGVIRIRELADPQVARHVLMHELGHGFGFAHNSLAIMDENTVDRAMRGVEPYLGMIETPAWKMVLRAGDAIDFTASDVCGGVAGMGTHWHHTFNELRKLLNLPTGNLCLGFKLEYLEKKAIPFGGYSREMLLTVTAPGGAKATLKGVAKITDYGYAGPTLYAEYKGQGFEPAVHFTKRYPELFDDGYLTEGYFELGDLKIPMGLSFYRGPDQQTGPGEVPNPFGDKGPRLKLFNPKTSEWTTIK